MISIAIVGPESTGKSTLAKALADHFKAICVPEYSREFLNKLDRPYQQQDLLEIAKGQLLSAENEKSKSNRILILDTDLFVIKVWSEFKYGECDPQILKMLKDNQADFYILTAADIPYEYDPLRENPDDREELFEIYHQELVKAKVKFSVLKGTSDERLHTAIQAINEIL